MMPIDRSAVESFLYREARLMDAYQYDEWLALCHDVATYCALQRRRYRPVPQCLGHLRSSRPTEESHQRLKETSWLREQAPRLKRLAMRARTRRRTDDGNDSAPSPFEVAPGSRPLPASGKPESVGSLEPLLRFREREGERVGAAAR